MSSEKPDDEILKLDLSTQHYDWGKHASESIVAKLINKENDNKPYAELWMGTHKSGPSYVIKDDKKHLLSQHIGYDLPYLFKVLSVSSSLSIQAHPDKQLAGQLNSKRPDVYKDNNHKPEMAIALTEFEAMCNFRPCDEIAHYLKNVPALQNIVGKELSKQFIDVVENEIQTEIEHQNENEKKNDKHERVSKLLKEVFSKIMMADENEVKKELNLLTTQILNGNHIPFFPHNEEKNDENNEPFQRNIEINELVSRLNKQYPFDVGIFAAFMLNCFRLKPGECIFLEANLPHAYLKGDCLECMACSDNVVRAGLTNKLRDTPVLCSMLNYTPTVAIVTGGEKVADHTLQYSPPVDEFRLDVTLLKQNEKEIIYLTKDDDKHHPTSQSKHHSIILIFEGRGVVNDIEINAGDCLLIPPTIKRLSMKTNNEKGMKLARCFTPIKFSLE